MVRIAEDLGLAEALEAQRRRTAQRQAGLVPDAEQGKPARTSSGRVDLAEIDAYLESLKTG
jgi:hypothetical protein